MKNTPKVKKILYASDLGEHTRPVFRFALSLADKYDAEVYMLHVAEPMSSTAETVISTYLSEDAADQIQKAGMLEVNTIIKKRLKNFCQEEDVNKDNPPQVKETIVVNGKPSEEVLRVARDYEIDLIVMGKSTRKLLGNKMMGSCARRVSRHANIPVLVIPNL